MSLKVVTIWKSSHVEYFEEKLSERTAENSNVLIYCTKFLDSDWTRGVQLNRKLYSAEYQIVFQYVTNKKSHDLLIQFVINRYS